MKRKDFSMIALIFFITRCFFSLYNYNNLFNFLIVFLTLLISIFIIKKIKINLFDYKLFKYIYILIIVSILALILVDTTMFINNNYFRENNYFSIIVSLVIISYLLGKDDIKTISSMSEILVIIFFLVSIIIYIGLISLLDIELYSNYFRFRNITYNFLPLLSIFILYYLRENNITLGFVLGSISSFIDNFLTIGCLGKLIVKYKFPAISILKSLNYFHFINHLDKLFSFIYLFEYTITLALIFNIIKKLVKTSS